MAQPRFNGRGFTNPLNPLGFHSENRYREETPLGSNFMSNEVNYEAETRVFRVGPSPTSLVDDAIMDGVIKNLDEAAMPMLKLGLKGAMEGAGESDAAIRNAVVDGVIDGMQKNIDDVLVLSVKQGDELGTASTKILDDVTKSINKMVDEGKIGKEAGQEMIEAFGKQLDEATGVAKIAPDAVKGVDDVVSNADNLLKTSKELPLWAKGGMATGAVGATVWLVYQLGSSFGAVGKEWVEDFTGGNCGEKVADRGLEVGTEEFNLEVEECQEAAAKRMLIATGGGLLVVCGLVYVLVKK